MRTYLDCVACLVRGTVDAVRRVTADGRVQEEVLRGVLDLAARMDFRQPPPAMGQAVHRLIRRATGNSDPYREAKERLNRLALELYPGLRARVLESADPLEAALRAAAAGNVIDLAVKSSIEESDVRSAPTINDATRADAEASGMAGMVEVIDSGSDAPGTILEDCSAEFRRRFEAADLVLAKGQGNYETLGGAGRGKVFFLLRAKCPVVAGDIGCPVGGLMLLRDSRRGGNGSA